VTMALGRKTTALQSDALRPSFSIVLPAYRRMNLLERSIRHLAAMDYPADRFEVVVVDHHGGTAADIVGRLVTESECMVRLERCIAVDAPSKRNFGARVAQGEYVLFMNDDIWAAPHLLLEHARTHARFAPAEVAVLGHVDQSPSMPRSAFIEFYRPYAYGAIADRADQAVDWYYFWAPNISLRRSVLLEGQFFFREDWPALVHEDVELGYRWVRAGRQVIYNPRAVAQHYHPHTLESAAHLQETIGRYLPLLERLVDEPRLVERYGVFTWRNSTPAILRGLVRSMLFNSATVPPIQSWLSRQKNNTRLTRWLYWKVLLHYTNRGYRHGRPTIGSASA
jgi:glycosyltransferase involved in cell wall biosynthesis